MERKAQPTVKKQEKRERKAQPTVKKLAKKGKKKIEKRKE